MLDEEEQERSKNIRSTSTSSSRLTTDSEITHRLPLNQNAS